MDPRIPGPSDMSRITSDHEDSDFSMVTTRRKGFHGVNDSISTIWNEVTVGQILDILL